MTVRLASWMQRGSCWSRGCEPYKKRSGRCWASSSGLGDLPPLTARYAPSTPPTDASRGRGRQHSLRRRPTRGRRGTQSRWPPNGRPATQRFGSRLRGGGRPRGMSCRRPAPSRCASQFAPSPPPSSSSARLSRVGNRQAFSEPSSLSVVGNARQRQVVLWFEGMNPCLMNLPRGYKYLLLHPLFSSRFRPALRWRRRRGLTPDPAQKDGGAFLLPEQCPSGLLLRSSPATNMLCPSTQYHSGIYPRTQSVVFARRSRHHHSQTPGQMRCLCITKRKRREDGMNKKIRRRRRGFAWQARLGRGGKRGECAECVVPGSFLFLLL